MNDYAVEIKELEQVHNYTKWLREILDAKYENSDLNKVMKNQCQYLTETKCNELLKLLQKIEELFYVTIGTWKTHPADFVLKNMRSRYVQEYI